MTVETYSRMRAEAPRSDAQALLRVYVRGVAEGLEWANAYLEKDGRPMLFCAPSTLALNADNYVQIIDDALKVNRQEYATAGIPIAAILTQAIRVKLPCPTPR